MRATMTQADIEVAFKRHIGASMRGYGIYDLPILQHFDYLKKGRKDFALYFTVQNPRRVANAHRSYDPVSADDAGHVESQHFEADVSITCLSEEEKTGVAPLDLAMTAAQAVGSLPFVEAMRADGLGVQACSNIPTVHANDDPDNFALECSFSFPITFSRHIMPLTKTIMAAELNSFLL